MSPKCTKKSLFCGEQEQLIYNNRSFARFGEYIFRFEAQLYMFNKKPGKYAIYIKGL